MRRPALGSKPGAGKTQNTQPAIASGDVDIIAHHRDIMHRLLCLVPANLHRLGGIRYIDDVQSATFACHVNVIAHHHDAFEILGLFRLAIGSATCKTSIRTPMPI
jgi:hypothetical protein